MAISNGNVIDGSTINTHAPSAIFLGNQKNRNRTRTKVLTNVPAVQKVLDLSLNFLSLVGVDPVGVTVWQAHPWNQINIVLNASHRW
jgi:hypothetical protein